MTEPSLSQGDKEKLDMKWNKGKELTLLIPQFVKEKKSKEYSGPKKQKQINIYANVV